MTTTLGYGNLAFEVAISILAVAEVSMSLGPLPLSTQLRRKPLTAVSHSTKWRGKVLHQDLRSGLLQCVSIAALKPHCRATLRGYGMMTRDDDDDNWNR